MPYAQIECLEVMESPNNTANSEKSTIATKGAKKRGGESRTASEYAIFHCSCTLINKYSILKHFKVIIFGYTKIILCTHFLLSLPEKNIELYENRFHQSLQGTPQSLPLLCRG